MSGLEPIPYSDAQLRAILQRVKTIAMVGASPAIPGSSPGRNRPSYFVMKYLQNKGYRVIRSTPASLARPCSSRADTFLGIRLKSRYPLPRWIPASAGKAAR